MNTAFQYRLEKSEYLFGLRVMAQILAVENRLSYLEIALLCLAAALPILIWGASLGAIIFALLAYGQVFRLWQRRLQEATFERSLADIQLRIDPNGVLQQQRDTDLRWSWTALRRVHDLPEAVILEFSGWRHLTLPARLWNDIDRRSVFISEIRGLAPGLQPDFAREHFGLASRSSLLRGGSIAAGISALFVVITLSKAFLLDNVGHSIAGAGATVATLVTIVLIAMPFFVAYLAYRLAFFSLDRMQGNRPERASLVAHIYIYVLFACLFVMLLAHPILRPGSSI